MFPWNLFPNQNNQFSEWMKKLNESGMEQHIDQLLSKFKDNQSFTHFTNSEKKTVNESISIFETIDYIFVTISKNENLNMDLLSVSYTYNQLFIVGLNETNEPTVFTLPSLVKKSNAEVRKTNDKVEIKFPKFHDNNRVELNLN